MTYAGIDLGTTNSAICTYDGDKLHICKSPEQNDITPSAICFDRRGGKFVGQRAYDSAALNPDSVAVLFKRFMGTGTRIAVPACHLELTPEECSAELLRVLFGYLPEEVRTAGVAGTIITVPAAFNQMQKEATLAAAEQAQIGKVLLLQEPVAAIMTVMRTRADDGRFLIYDLGGGTLDIAIAESIGGRVTLLTHGGIPMCGGRDIDRLIVEHVVLPWLRHTFTVPEDALQTPRYSALARMAGWAAERAKIQLSSRDEAIISADEGDLRVRDEQGQEIYLNVPISRTVFDGLIKGLIDETIAAARDALGQAGLSASDVARLVYVGGPTLYKPLRDQVSSALGIAPSTEVNPMTAVAEGAAVYAETVNWSDAKRGKKAVRGTLDAGAGMGISFAYMARTPSLETKCAVKLTDAIADGHEFQIDSLDSGWSSGRIRLANGVILELPLSKSGANTFKVFVFRPTGEPLRLPDDRLSIIRTAATVDSIPASHSVGVEVLERIGGQSTLEYLVRAGDSLPKKGNLTFRAAESLKAGSSGALNFKLWEGEIAHPVSDNRFIGAVKILGSDVDDGVIPAGAELICDYEVLESGTVNVSITAPSIGATFNTGHNFYSPQDGQVDFAHASQLIAKEAEQVRTRVDAIAEKVESDKLEKAQTRLASAAELSSSGDPESSKHALEDVLEAKRLLAQVRQDNLQQIRQLDLDGEIEAFNGMIRNVAKPSETTSFDNLVASARRAITRTDGEFDGYLTEMRRIIIAVLWRQDWFLIDRFNDLSASPDGFADAAHYGQLIARGKEAVRADDMATLRTVLAELYESRMTIGGEEGMFDAVNLLRG